MAGNKAYLTRCDVTPLLHVQRKNVRVTLSLVRSSQLHLFRVFHNALMIAVYKPDIEILIATFCFQELVVKECKSTAAMGNL